jgi:hypothetical protein
VPRLDHEHGVVRREDRLDEVGPGAVARALDQVTAIGRPGPEVVVHVDQQRVVGGRPLDQVGDRGQRLFHGSGQRLGVRMIVRIEHVGHDQRSSRHAVQLPG